MERSSLLEPYRLNDRFTLRNKIIMAPMTRCFAADGLVPTADMAAYYARRADAGLIVTEGTVISAQGRGHPNPPGLFTDAQIDGWRGVTDAVHENDGVIFAQLWHTGRVSHSIYHEGAAPVAPSAVQLEGTVSRTDGLRYEIPRALTTAEVTAAVADYARAARNAIAAGFDGVEIHGANGYFIDQFLHQDTNCREDKYGGSVENRARFALEVVDAVMGAVGADRTGLRLSPAAYLNMTHTMGDEDTFAYLLRALNPAGLAYVHVGMFDDALTYDYLGGRVSAFMRKHYTGTLIGCGSYTLETAQQELADGSVDLVALGRPFLANPDLIAKVKTGTPMAEYDTSFLAALT